MALALYPPDGIRSCCRPPPSLWSKALCIQCMEDQQRSTSSARSIGLKWYLKRWDLAVASTNDFWKFAFTGPLRSLVCSAASDMSSEIAACAEALLSVHSKLAFADMYPGKVMSSSIIPKRAVTLALASILVTIWQAIGFAGLLAQAKRQWCCAVCSRLERTMFTQCCVS